LVTTYGERVVDVFYVKDTFGMQVTHEGKLDQIRKTVLEVITENEVVVDDVKSIKIAS
jgi:[protein-PII] uridylyltransferase